MVKATLTAMWCAVCLKALASDGANRALLTQKLSFQTIEHSQGSLSVRFFQKSVDYDKQIDF